MKTPRTRLWIRLAFAAALLAGMTAGAVASWAANITYFSQGSLDPNVTTSWNTARAGGGTAPSNFSSGDVFVIQNGQNMTVTATGWALYGTGPKLWIESGGTLTANYAVTLNPSTTFQIDGGGTYVHNNSVGYASSIFRAGTTSLAPTSTVILNNSSDIGPAGVTFGNLIVNLPTIGGSVQCNGGLTTINGSFTIISTAGGAFRLTLETGCTLTVAGDLLIQGGTLDLSKGSTAGVTNRLNLGGNFTQTGGALTCTNANSPATVALSAGVTSVTFASTAGTLASANVNWLVAPGKTVAIGSNTSSAVVLGGSGRTIAIDGALQIGSGSSPVLAGSTNVSGTGSLLVQGGGTVYVGNSDGSSPGTLTNNGATTIAGTLRLNPGSSFAGTAPLYGGSSTLIYTRAGTVGSEWGPGASAGPGVPQDVQVRLGGLSGVLGLTGDRSVPGTLTFLSPGGIVSTGSYVLSVGSTAGAPTSGWVNGRERLAVAAPGTKTFDTGDATHSLPVSVAIASLATPGSLTVGSTPSAHPALASSSIDPAKYVRRYWTLASTGLAATYNATFNFLAADVQGSADYNRFVVGAYNGAWTYPSMGTRSATSCQATGVSTFGDFAIGEQAGWVITASSTPGGTISPSGSVAVGSGVDQSFSASADAGYHLVDLVVDHVSQGPAPSYTFTNVTASHSVRAQFVADSAPADLVAWWAMDDASGMLAHDGSGHGNDGALVNGSSWPAGRSGTALGLDGVSQYAYVPPNNTLDLTSALTLAAWIRPAAMRAQDVIAKGLAGGTDGYELDLSGDGHPLVRLNQLSQTPRLDAVTTCPADGSTWTHVAATFDGVYVRIYVNGVEDNASTVPSTLTVRPNALPLAVGAQVDTVGLASRFFQGAIDDARVYARALSATEIRMLAGLTTYQITASAGSGGAISPAGTVYVVPGASQTFAITPNPGYSIADVLADGASVGPAASYTFSSVSSNHTIAARFSLLNSPPALPVVVAPPNAATGVSPSPSLDVTVSDPDGGALTVTYYGRPAGQMSPAADFSLVVLPDTQNYTGSTNGGSPAILTSQIQWVVDNRIARNTAYVAQVGDLTQNGDRYEVEWQAADDAFRLLENPTTCGLPDGLPYGIAVGNHEQVPDGATLLFNQYFGVARFAGRSYYGGHYGVNNNNHFDLFSASGMDFIVIHLELNDSPNPAVLSWADGLLKSHPSRRGIVVSHHLIDPTEPASWGAQGQLIYDALKGDPNLFLMLCGHMTTEGARSDTYNGTTINTLLADYQDRDHGGDGWLRLLEFSPASDEIRVRTYSPWLDSWETDASSEFSLAYDMPASTPTPYVAIGTVTGVASGSTCRMSWPGRTPDTTYEWYATVSDGQFTTIGPTCTFTTGNGVAPPQVADLAATPVGAGGSSSQAIQLTWAATAAGTTVELWRSAFGHYPEYGRAGAWAPAAPTAWSDPPAAGWSVAGTVAGPAATLSDQVAARDCYYYVAFQRDGAGTPSISSTMTRGTLNYILGDVSNGVAVCAGDNAVNTADISLLGMSYGETVGLTEDPEACLDVGPTIDGGRASLPAPDGVLNFEDLVMFALNYTGWTGGAEAGPVAGRAPGASDGASLADALALQAPALPEAGEVFDVSIRASASGHAQAVTLELGYDHAVLEMVGASAGELLSRQPAPAVVFTPGPGRVDLALLGKGAALSGSGELVKVRFRVKGTGDPQLDVASVEARDGENQKVAFATSGAGGPAPPPTVTSLAAARPNPFERATTLGFSLAVGGPVELVVYGVDGRRLATLVKGARDPGVYQFTWDGRDANGQDVRPGVYYARLSTPQGRFMRRLVLVR